MKGGRSVSVVCKGYVTKVVWRAILALSGAWGPRELVISDNMLHWNRASCGRAAGRSRRSEWKLRHQVAAACLRAADRLDQSGSGSRVVFKFRSLHMLQ